MHRAGVGTVCTSQICALQTPCWRVPPHFHTYAGANTPHSLASSVLRYLLLLGLGWSVSKTARPAACRSSGLRQRTQHQPQAPHPQQQQQQTVPQQGRTQQRCRAQAEPQAQRQRAPGRQVQLAWLRP